MMRKDEAFVWIMPKEDRPAYESQEEYLKHCGKLIMYDQKGVIESLGSKMLGLVGKDGILQAKFTRSPALDVPEGCVPGRDHALIVYCDDRNRGPVKRELRKELGVKKMFWKYDRDTINGMLGRKS